MLSLSTSGSKGQGGGQLMVIPMHAAAASAALVLGAAMLLLRKGTPLHKALGRAWVGLMLLVALSSFWIFEIREGAGPSFIHLLSAWTLISLACAIAFIRRGNVRMHKYFMVGTFLGLLGAGIGALMPGRLLYQLLAA
jgi:uncharacterized membrane protein